MLASVQFGELLSATLTATLAPAVTLKHLELGVHLSPPQLRALACALSSAGALRSLSLAGSRLGDAGFAELQAAFAACVSLQELDLAGCALTDAGAASFASVLRRRAAQCAPASSVLVSPHRACWLHRTAELSV